MNAIIFSSKSESSYPKNIENQNSGLIKHVDSVFALNNRFKYLKYLGINELTIVEGPEYHKYASFLSNLEGVSIPLKVISNPFYKTTKSLVAVWTALSEINNDLVILDWDTLFNQVLLECFTKSGNGKACFVVRTESASDTEYTHTRAQNKEIVKIDNAKILESRILSSSVCLCSFRESGVSLIKKSIEEEIRTKEARQKDIVHAIHRLIKKGHMVCRVNSLRNREFFKIYINSPGNTTKVGAQFGQKINKISRDNKY